MEIRLLKQLDNYEHLVTAVCSSTETRLALVSGAEKIVPFMRTVVSHFCSKNYHHHETFVWIYFLTRTGNLFGASVPEFRFIDRRVNRLYGAIWEEIVDKS